MKWTVIGLGALCACGAANAAHAALIFTGSEGSFSAFGEIDGLATVTNDMQVSGDSFFLGQAMADVEDGDVQAAMSAVTGLAIITDKETGAPNIEMGYSGGGWILPGYSGFMGGDADITVMFTIDDVTPFTETFEGDGSFVLSPDDSGGDPGQIIGDSLAAGDYKIESSYSFLFSGPQFFSDDTSYELNLIPAPGAAALLLAGMIGGCRRRRR